MENLEEKHKNEANAAGKNLSQKKEKVTLPADFKGAKRDSSIREFTDRYDGKWWKVTFLPRPNIPEPFIIVKDSIAWAFTKKLERFNSGITDNCDVVSVEEYKAKD